MFNIAVIGSRPPRRSLAQQIVQQLPLGRAGVNGLYLPYSNQSASGTSLDAWGCSLGIGPAWSFLSSARPALTAGAINGAPAALFDGVDDGGVAVGAALNWSRNISGLTMLTVAKTVVSAQQGVIVATSTNVMANNRTRLSRDDSAGTVRVGGRRLDADGFVGFNSGTSSTVAFTIDVAVYDYANAKAYLYQNGTATGTSPLDPWLTTGSTSNTASAAVSMGANGDLSGTFFHGYIAAVGCFVGVLSAATIVNVSRVLGRQFGITTA